MPTGYGVPKTERGMLPWAATRKMLESARSYWLVTIDPDGKPRVALTHGDVTSGVWLKDRRWAIRAALVLEAGGPRVEILDEDQRPVFRKP